jgi:hypothetical protein
VCLPFNILLNCDKGEMDQGSCKTRKPRVNQEIVFRSHQTDHWLFVYTRTPAMTIGVATYLEINIKK